MYMAETHPPRHWMPKRSFSSAEMKLQCKKRLDFGWRIIKEKMGSRTTWAEPKTCRVGTAPQRFMIAAVMAFSLSRMAAWPTAACQAESEAEEAMFEKATAFQK